MKKTISFILVVIMCLALAACSNSRPDDSVKEIAPQASQMKSICELATMKTSLDKGTQRKTTENELPSLTQCTA